MASTIGGSDADLEAMPLGEYRLDQRRRGLLPSTIARRDTSLRTFSRWLQPRSSLLTATELDVETFLDTRNLSAKGRYCWLSNLHSFYVWAVRAKYRDDDPTERIVRPKLRRRLPRPATDDDVDFAIRHTVDPELQAWAILSAYAGLRCMEIAGLEHDAMADHGAGLMLHVVGKGAKERTVPVHPMVAGALQRHGIPRTGRMFRRAGGRPWTPEQVSARGNRHLRDLGLEITMHQFRHWFGTRTYAISNDLRIVQELLGHSTPAVTAVYTAWSRPAAIDAVLSLGMDGPLTAPAQRPIITP